MDAPRTPAGGPHAAPGPGGGPHATGGLPSRARCAAHPARPARDRCPVCGRARCGTDARTAPGGGCLVCLGRPAQAAAPSGPPPPEQVVRAGLAASGVAFAAAPVWAQYVGAGLIGHLVPVVVGVLAGAAAASAARSDGRGPTGGAVRLAAAAWAVLGVALGLLLEGSRAPLSTAALLPCVSAAAGALLWTQPVRVRRAAAAS